MADHDERLRPTAREVSGQPADHLDVEMVGRLVEHQDVVSGQQHLGQRDPAPLTAGRPATSASRSMSVSRCSTTVRVSGSAAQM